jgi:hypothetical protein
MISKKLILLSAVLLAASPALRAEMRGSLGVEGRYYAEQSDLTASVFVEPEWNWQSTSNEHTIVIKPFVRLDGDSGARDHADIREMYYQYADDRLELKLGVDKIYWGVTESQHLVDVINQTDVMEGFDGEDKLGQPMAQLTWKTAWGVVDMFALPVFRERKFPDLRDRIKITSPINGEEYPLVFGSEYYQPKEKNRWDAALRYSHTLGDWDFGVSYFDGKQREPFFIDEGIAEDQHHYRFGTYYPRTQQLSVDVQATINSWLWKLEALERQVEDVHFSDYRVNAYTAGFEYTFYGIVNSAFDVGVLLETSQNSYPARAPFFADNEVFLGARLTANDEQSSELLFGISQDTKIDDSYSAKLEASRRIGDNFKLSLDAWLFNVNEYNNTLSLFRKNDFVQVDLEYFY